MHIVDRKIGPPKFVINFAIGVAKSVIKNILMLDNAYEKFIDIRYKNRTFAKSFHQYEVLWS